MVVVNIGDVAADAGVSRSTVSYVLSGTRTISPETRERVRASIRKLGYRPNPAARALTLKRTLAWDPDQHKVINDEEANRLLKRPYRSGYTHPADKA